MLVHICVYRQFHRACVGGSQFAQSCPSCQGQTVAEWGGKSTAPAAAGANTSVVDLTSERPAASAHGGAKDKELQEGGGSASGGGSPHGSAGDAGSRAEEELDQEVRRPASAAAQPEVGIREKEQAKQGTRAQGGGPARVAHARDAGLPFGGLPFDAPTGRPAFRCSYGLANMYGVCVHDHLCRQTAKRERRRKRPLRHRRLLGGRVGREREGRERGKGERKKGEREGRKSGKEGRREEERERRQRRRSPRSAGKTRLGAVSGLDAVLVGQGTMKREEVVLCGL